MYAHRSSPLEGKEWGERRSVAADIPKDKPHLGDVGQGFCPSPSRHAELVSASIVRQSQSMRHERNPFVYILASGHYGRLYVGVTADLIGRLWQHRNAKLPGFTFRYAVHRLVYFEGFDDIENAISREKQLKNWRRQWKINLINEANAEWRDLAVGLGLPPL